MSQSTNLDPKRVTRAGIWGALLGILAILLFVGLWIGLGSIGVTVFPRLVISVCIPPAILSLIAGFYLLVKAPSSSNGAGSFSVTNREPTQE